MTFIFKSKYLHCNFRLYCSSSSFLPPTLKRVKTNSTELYDQELSIISTLKSIATHSSISHGQQVHCTVLKSGLDSNSFIKNSLINMYAKCGLIPDVKSLFDPCSETDLVSCNIMISGYLKSGQLSDAYEVFLKMPRKGCVSYTTMIMGFVKKGHWEEAIGIFKEMRMAGVIPNEATTSTVITACCHTGGIWDCRMLHGLVIKLLLDGFVIVATNLLNTYCMFSELGDARHLFDEMVETNTVSWNVMLNGYCKAGLLDSARHLFEEIPHQDVVSWGTMLSGYVRVGRLREALIMYRAMVCYEFRPNDVMLNDLVSACARSVALVEGQQLHSTIMRRGFDSYDIFQATIIHFYAACRRLDLACLQFEIGYKDHLASLNALITGYVRNGMINEAADLFNGMSKRDVFSWSTMISGYTQHGKPGMALLLFHRMLAAGVFPNEITMVGVFSAIAALGELKEGQWAHEYIQKNSIPLSDNLSAAVIDMYAKCGSISSALEVFYQIREKAHDISPWNAIICGLAKHGHFALCLELFSDLEKRNIKVNSITLMGILTACCHAGLVEAGERYFRNMKTVYNVEPDIKHYGCMVDILGRAGRLEEAEELIKSMPMEADVAVWGALLAASRTHGNVDIGEQAARNLARLEPDHGPSQVLLSDIYADAGRWDEAFSLRSAVIQQQKDKITRVKWHQCGPAMQNKMNLPQREEGHLCIISP